MPTSRRNMIVGLGALTVGGGAVFGSGAFSSFDADRTIQVNVVTGDDLDGIDEGDDAAVIAERFVDVRVDVDKFDSVHVNDVGTAGSALAPQDGSAVGSEGEVSLIANDDPTIIFGGDGEDGLPANSRVSYEELFILDNADIDAGNTNEAFDVTLELDGDLLTIEGGDEENPFKMNDFNSGTDNGGPQSFNSQVNTGEDDDSNILTITIEKSN